MTHRHVLVSVAATLCLGASARAADIDVLLAAPELTLAQTRSGAYLRADLFYDVGSDLGTERRLRAPSGAGSLPFGSTEFDGAAAFGLGVGYQFTDMLRADLTARYGEPEFESGAFLLPGCGSLCFAREGADARSWEVLANGYVDLGTVARFTPYVGGGLGAVRLSYDDPVLAMCGAAACGKLSGSSVDDWRFAYAASAGVAYDLTDAVSLDVGYRYLNVDGGNGYRFGGLSASTLEVADDGYDQHAVRVGLRYKLW